VHASVDEQERDQFARWSEWVVRHGEERDVLQELVRDSVERCAHLMGGSETNNDAE